jgi:hypothetical protein
VKIRFLIASVIIFFSPPCFAGQVYEWIDKDGVKHFTNEPPPPGAKIVEAEKEIPNDPAAEKAQAESANRFLQQNHASDAPPPAVQPESDKTKSAEAMDVEKRSKTWHQKQITEDARLREEAGHSLDRPDSTPGQKKPQRKGSEVDSQ